jgi:hypothetical protein
VRLRVRSCWRLAAIRGQSAALSRCRGQTFKYQGQSVEARKNTGLNWPPSHHKAGGHTAVYGQNDPGEKAGFGAAQKINGLRDLPRLP